MCSLQISAFTQTLFGFALFPSTVPKTHTLTSPAPSLSFKNTVKGTAVDTTILRFQCILVSSSWNLFAFEARYAYLEK